MSNKVIATWIVELNCECPNCNGDVDLTDYPDFWIESEFEIAEHGTENSRDVKVVCPKCAHEFKVDLEY